VLAGLVMFRHPDFLAIHIDRERWTRGEGRGLDTRNGSNAIERLAVELAAPDFVVSQHPGIGGHHGEAFHGKPDVGALSGDQAARQKRGHDQEQRGDRHLTRDQQIAQRPPPAGHTRHRMFAAQVRHEVRLGGLERRNQAGEKRGQERDHGREKQYPAVDSEIERQGNWQRQAKRTDA
jgi:hypothetical protein